MKKLELDDFDAFFEEVHGVRPFAWQQRLAKLACRGNWPTTISVPTGAGKTASLDVATFALALSAQTGETLAPRRIVMVVDRRVVVDQAHARARKLEAALRNPAPKSVCARVAALLSGLTSTAQPLKAVQLRGAIPRDDNWASTPDQPLIISSTVDQVGSRLLFRGYGVSPSMWPIHAGLLGTDCLYLLDEVHLAQPYFETLAAVQRVTEALAAEPMRRFQVVALSATPGTGEADMFSLNEKERTGPLEQRLAARKPVELTTSSLESLPQTVTRHVTTALETARTVLVVHNRVQRAIDGAAALKRGLEGKADVRLLTGRMRPIDRAALVKVVTDRVSSGTRSAAEPSTLPLVVVATQAIEAGADFDFDAIVTELASFDALKQRFGRVDRLGEFGKATGTIIEVHEPNEKGDVQLLKDDPVYGSRLVACSKLLKELKKKAKKAGLDFGIDALEGLVGQVDGALVSEAISEKPSAPPLFPAYLDLWAQTRPAPPPSFTPDVSLFLHGPPSTPDVAIIWRADLDAVDEAECCARIQALPPSAAEAVSVPFIAAKKWLARAGSAEFSDVEGRPEIGRETGSVARRVFRWTSDGATRLSELKPGDTIVVSTREGGLWEGNFDGVSETPVTDRAEEAIFQNRGRATLRCELRHVSRMEDGFDFSGCPDWVAPMVESLGSRPRVIELDGWTLLVGRKRLKVAEDGHEFDGEATTDDQVSTSAGNAVLLSVHSGDVERWSRDFATKLRLDDALVACLSFAGWLHDVGKADPRFQRLLRDGTEASVAIAKRSSSDWLLAKSGMGQNETARAKLARQRSGYAKGARHEVLSAAMCSSDAVWAEAQRRGVKDRALLLHLIASHHGWCRPFAPTYVLQQEDDAARTAEMKREVAYHHGDLALTAAAATDLHRLDSGLAERFAELTQRYGWHQLAALEGVLRLADHRASEEEAEQEDSRGDA